MMQKCDIRPEDEQYIPMYLEYKDMLREGHKVTYIQDFLSGKYGICQRSVYNIYKRLDEHVTI